MQMSKRVLKIKVDVLCQCSSIRPLRTDMGACIFDSNFYVIFMLYGVTAASLHSIGLGVVIQ